MNWDTISRKALLEEFSRKCCGECCICVERDNESGECGLIRYIPPIDIELVQHGEWIKRKNSKYLYYCSNCKYDAFIRQPLDDKSHNYCPSCGAKMRYRR